jgi:DNA-binding MarR family transcriptional regulator
MIDEQAEQLAQLFERMGILSRSPAFGRLVQLNLGISHLKALRHISLAGEMQMKELAELLHLSPPSVTTLVRRLEQTGLVERTRMPGDSRVWLLRLTAEGQELSAALRRQRLEMMQRLLATLDAEERGTLLRLLAQAVGAAEQIIEKSDDEQ